MNTRVLAYNRICVSSFVFESRADIFLSPSLNFRPHRQTLTHLWLGYYRLSTMYILLIPRSIFNPNSTFSLFLILLLRQRCLTTSLSLSLVRFKRFWYPYPPLFNLFIHLDFPPLQIFSFPFSLLSFSFPTFLTKSLPTSLPNQPRRNINLWKYCGAHRKPKPKLRNRRRFLSQVPWTVSSFPYSWYCPTKLFSFYIEWTAKISWIQFGPSRYIAIIFVPFLSLFFFFFLDEWKIELQFRNYRIYREDRFYVSVLRLT